MLSTSVPGQLSVLEPKLQRNTKLDFFAFELRSPVFTLDESFIDEFRGQQPQWGPIGYVTYKRTYARKLCDCLVACNHPTEEFWQTCRRVVEGVYRIQQRHCQLYGLRWTAAKAQRSARTMFRLMWDFKFLPPGRGLWMMGTEYIERTGGAALNNCAFVSTEQIDVDFSAPFAFLMDMSMLGVGVGGDCRGAGKVKIQRPIVDMGFTYVVEDSREGWIDLVRRRLDSYVGAAVMPGKIDYSRVRPAGAPIKGFGGTSAGPEPLRRLVEVDLPSVLSPLVALCSPITSEAIVDIFNYIGKCVVAGNVRRTAEIMFGDPTDEEFMDLKDPVKNLHALNDRRWASNNSIFAEVGMNYQRPAILTQLNGEPGYEWLENARAFGRMIDPPDNRDHRAMGGNPCLEQTLESFELCCLVETFPSRHDTYEEYERTLKFAYIYAKTVTLVMTHDERTNAVLGRNKRIGASQSGITQAFARRGKREHFRWCDRGYKYLRGLDEKYSGWLCVNQSIKITSVKPSGTVSLLPGVSPGIHYPEAQYYIRRIRVGTDSPLIPALRRAGYLIEPALTDPERTLVVAFPVKEPFFTKAESEVSMWEQVANAVAMQRWWADNQVSCTVKFHRHEEGKDIAAALELFEDQLKGISFLPHDSGYEQMPYEEISAELYDWMTLSIKPLDLSGAVNEVQDKYCDGDRCELPGRKDA